HLEILLRAADLIAKERVAPLDRAADRFRVGVDEQARGVEAMPFLRPIRSVHTVAVQLAGAHVGKIAVPDLVVSLAQRDARALDGIIGPAEQTQLEAARVFREDREVDAFAIPVGAERVWVAGPYAHVSDPRGDRGQRSRGARGRSRCRPSASLG